MLKIAWSRLYNHPLSANHRFPMLKYDLLPEQLLYEGTVAQANFFEPGKLTDHQIESVHVGTYWRKLRSLELSPAEARRTGFPLSALLVEREVNIAAGTLQCALFARQHGIAINIAGGTHHAFTDRGEGFCLLNDMAIAAANLLSEGLASRILFVDLDVHQGNGSAAIFTDNPQVFTFSMHGEKNYPFHKEQSDLDIALPDGTGDRFYLEALSINLNHLVESFEPDFIFYQAGVDVLATDKLGKLSMSQNGCRARDRIVLDLCYRNAIPVVITMGGGYSEKVSDIVEAHANTFRLAQEIFF